jgi:glycine hydroxymethyltransferase
MSSYSYLDRLENAVRLHDQWRLGECLNLCVSENFSSPDARKMLMTDFSNRYTTTDKFYKGTKFMDEVQSLTEEVARKVFNARFADVRPLSGHIADMAMLYGLTKRGDKVLSVSNEDGGYQGPTQISIGKMLGLKNLYFPFDREAVNIDVKETKRMLQTETPNLIVFGSSIIPFPHPVREISGAADSETVCVYDGAHVLGLIAGGEFQDPLREGCSLLVGSTHKSFPGPQGGIVLGNNDKFFTKVSSEMFPVIVDNIHWNRVASLAVTLMEMLQFGKTYAQAVVKNSQALGKSLAENHVAVRGASHGYSKSHQVLLGYDKTKTEFIAKRLEEANIIIDNSGRVGTAEATRMGMGPTEMEQVGELIGLIVHGKKPVDMVKKRVKSLTKDFRTPKYVLRAAAEAQEKKA